MSAVRFTALRLDVLPFTIRSLATRPFSVSLLLSMVLACLSVADVHAQSADSTETVGATVTESVNTSPVQKSRLPANHSPRRALLRGLTIPGGGQIHNRQFWKLPFVYAGLGTMTWFSIQANQNHKLYTRAFQYKDWQDLIDAGSVEVHPFPEFEDQYNEVLVIEGCTGDCVATASRLKQIRDNFRRSRDLSRFGIGLVYGLSVIDAFVSAHLLDFDVSEDLTVQILPHPNGATALLHIGF